MDFAQNGPVFKNSIAYNLSIRNQSQAKSGECLIPKKYFDFSWWILIELDETNTPI